MQRFKDVSFHGNSPAESFIRVMRDTINNELGVPRAYYRVQLGGGRTAHVSAKAQSAGLDKHDDTPAWNQQVPMIECHYDRGKWAALGTLDWAMDTRVRVWESLLSCLDNDCRELLV
jgi:hypothetical protein